MTAMAATLAAADLTGIWSGQMAGRRGGTEDVAFQFKVNGGVLTGKMFGDEFDLPLENVTLKGDQIQFIVTTKNYYNRTETKTQFTGTIKDNEIAFTRERLGPPPLGANRPDRQNAPQTFTIKRLTRASVASPRFAA
jgi:hypothetical protein